MVLVASIMNHDRYDDSYIRGILNTVKTIAMVGASAKDNRPSYFAFKYLAERGYNMIPVNPGLGGKELLGRKIYGRLSEVREPIDMVDIFRASKYALPEQVLAGEARIDRDHPVAALEQVLEGEIARPVVLRRRADHRDGLHGVEDAADIAVVVIVVIHDACLGASYGRQAGQGPARGDQTKDGAFSA